MHGSQANSQKIVLERQMAMEGPQGEATRVFISYSWDSEEHKDRVLSLSNTLRRYGIDCQIDRYHQAPPEGWYRWMQNEINLADFVLVICTEKYNSRYRNLEAQGEGLGATWEGGLIISELYSTRGINQKYIPVLLSPEDQEHIPQSLQAFTTYRLFDELFDPEIEGGFQDLYRRLTNQPAVEVPSLGSHKTLLPARPAPFTLNDNGQIIEESNRTAHPQALPTPIESNGKEFATGSSQGLASHQKVLDVPDGQASQRTQTSPSLPARNRETTPVTGGQINHLIWLVPTIVAVVAVGAILSGQRNPENPGLPPSQDPASVLSESALAANISFGEKVLIAKEIIGEPNPAFEATKQRGVQAIANGNYEGAVDFLESALGLYQNAPETLIYLNNARIGANKAHILAVIAPVSADLDAASAILRGAAQAQEQINQQGGINGVPLKIAIVDDGETSETATQLAASLAENSEILGVVGHVSSQTTLATRAIYDAQGLPSISPTSTSVDLSDTAAGNTEGYGFRVVPTDEITARALADYMTETLGQSQVAIFYEQGDAYSESLSKEFALSIANAGGDVVDELEINEAGFRAEDGVEQALAAGAEVLMLAPSSQSQSVDQALKVVQANDRQVPLLGGDALYIPTLLEMEAMASGMVVAVFWDIDADQGSDFPDSSRSLWGAEVNWITALTYDATQAFIEAMKMSTNVNRRSIQEALASDEFRFEGATGNVRFRQNGDRQGRAQLVEVLPDERSSYGYDFVPVSE